MITDKFGNLLQELGKLLKTKLEPDKNNACLLKFKSGVSVQMELDSRGENLILAADLGTLSQGRYRENVFREALKANGLPPPRNGIFAFGMKNESLVLCDKLSLEELSGQKLADFLLQFTQKAELWMNGIKRGEVPSFMGNELSFGAATLSGGLFGLMR
jgi:hypothetical protein